MAETGLEKLKRADEFVRNLPGIKEDALAKLGPCRICGLPLLNGELTFYRIRVERAALDVNAIRRRVGLELQVGSAVLAQIMGPDNDIAQIMSGPEECVVHESCAPQIGHPLRLFPEQEVGELTEEDA